MSGLMGSMLVDTLLQAYHQSPRRLAVADGVRSLDYKQLALLASVLRDIIRCKTSCERVGIMLPASAAFPATLFGAFWASRVAVPLNFLLAPEELAPIVEDAGLDLILTIRHFDNLSAKLPARALCLEDLPLRRKVAMAMMRRLPKAPTPDSDATAVILYTSGTTGQPKGVELTHNNLYCNASDAIESLHIDSRHVFLNVLPPFHVFGLTASVIVPIALAATVHAIPRFSPLAVVKTVEQKQITLMMAIPSMYAAILKTKSARKESFRSIRLAVSGGEPLPDSVSDAFRERFGVTLCQGYGLTETSPVISACCLETYRAGTVGPPVGNVELRLIDADGREVPTGEDGEILVRGPSIMKGYYRNPEETRRVIDADGWFHTGDIGRLDADGYLSITGRAKEMLIIGGENVFPREIEAVLETHEGVLQAAVIGIPDDLRGELPVAFVIPQSEAEVTGPALRNHARNSLAGFKVPKRVIIREDLPRGPTGKILKRRLRDLL